VHTCFSDISLELFSNPIHSWKAHNDPVMGGKSTGNFTIKDDIGLFQGRVVDVPFLRAPGFITMQSHDNVRFSDVSSCNALEFTARTKSSYSGYRISFGTKQPPIHKVHAYGYKAHFDAPVGDEFVTVKIPFTNFSDYWDDATGELIKTCQDNPMYCPDEETLKDMKTISIWAEGVDGIIHFEIKSIAASGCKDQVSSLADDKSFLTFFLSGKQSDSVLESFSDLTHTWHQVNDPVMGGKSTGTFTIKSGTGIFDGHVVDVPSLKAPGFIKVESRDRTPFPDVRSCNALVLTARANNSYKGYRVSFGTKQPPVHKYFAYGFKAHFDAPMGTDFMKTEIPFVNFSDYWDDATGEQIKTCQEDKIYCPDDATLKDMKTISIWAEGVAGYVHLEVKSIAATGCSGDDLNLLDRKFLSDQFNFEKSQNDELEPFTNPAYTWREESDSVLESFSSPIHTWKQMNDPVMGGKSTGTFTIKSGTGIFDGHVVDVPSLKAPGFIKVDSIDRIPFPDVRSCNALVLTARANNSYKGYRVSFGTKQPPVHKFFAYGFKAHFDAPVGTDFMRIVIPFVNFSDYWDDATGEQIKTCQEDKIYCPDDATLKDMKTMSIWAEGVAGYVHLEVKSISATGCSEGDVGIIQPNYNNTCSQTIQDRLRYNLSNTNAAEDLPFPLPPGETLADAICCDAAFKPYAEPSGLYARDDVDLFSKINGTTTFYDSACGIPLFVIPRGRSFADFKADTKEHGWPSFRRKELISGNSHVIKESGEVISKCGTHLGSFLPDDKGDRWCLDLSCISGNPVTNSMPF